VCGDRGYEGQYGPLIAPSPTSHEPGTSTVQYGGVGRLGRVEVDTECNPIACPFKAMRKRT